ncbi:MAG: hypothetical protein JWQ10_2125 [Herbaspirillum sp.]|jgi:hypothetical protein|nr:hypothetical protein [Herbaspirillum sp.]
MKKLLGIAALMLAFSPFAHAQGYPGHPDARNDRHVEEYSNRRDVVVKRHPARRVVVVKHRRDTHHDMHQH